jgi:hypothetical protein
MKLTVVGALLSRAGAGQLHAEDATPFLAIKAGEPQVHMHLLNTHKAKEPSAVHVGEEHVTPPVSTTMKCVINLTIQYFIVYTSLAVVRTYNELNNAAPLTTAPKILEAACTTVNYAPMLSVLFLGTRMRALQLSGGNPDAYDLPQPWVKNAMQICSWSVLVQTLMVVAVPLVLGGEPKVDEDGTPIVEGSSGIMGKAFTAIKYISMLGMYGGFTTVCVGAFLMEPVKALFPAGPPPVSPAVQCTMNLTTQYFAVYLAIAIMKTYHEFNKETPMTAKLQGTLTLCQNTVNFAPMLSILFIGARMRALSMDPINGNPQKWAQNCFYLCTYSVLVQLIMLMAIPLVLDGSLKKGSTEGDITFELPNPTMMAILTAMRYMVMLALYGGFTAVIYSVMVIEAPPGMTYVPVSPAMQCTMNLTTQFFFVYLVLWILVTVKQFTSGMDGFLNIAIPTMDSARATVQFCPMLSILFIGTRMRALQIRPASEGGAPQGWAQEGMFLCTYSLLIQVLMVMVLPLFTRGAPEMDADGNPKVKATGLGAYALVAIRYTCFLALYGGVITLIYSLYTIEYATADGSGKVLGIDPPPAPPTPPAP